jgi:hypothetical protein
MSWFGDVPHQKWMAFYTRVLSRFAVGGNLKLTVTADVSPDGGVTPQQAEETRQALRELGLKDHVKLD